MNEPVSVQTSGGIAVLTVDVPPSNVLTARVRFLLVSALRSVQEAGRAHAIVLAARGKNYLSGPDPDTPDVLSEGPSLAELAKELEACTLPVVAALQGQASGPGLEIALAAHYRIADRRAKLSLPEIRYGLIPQAGATQRLPRIVGVDHALDLLISGRALSADAALSVGLVDAVAEGALPRFSLDWINKRVSQGLPPRRASDRAEPLQPAEVDLDRVRTIRAAQKKGTNPAIPKLLDCIEASRLLAFEAGLEMERAAYEDTLASKYSRAMRHVVRAEGRAVIAPTEGSAAPRRLSRIGLVGAGRIGRGVAAACLDAGYPVTLVESDIDRLEEAVEAIIDIYDRDIAQKRIDEVTHDRRIGNLSGTIDPASLATADLVIEATPEDAQVKRRVFSELDAILRRDAILATATSSLDLDGLAAGMERAGNVVGLHFFPPSYQMRAVEVVLGIDTSDETLATAFDFITKLNKIPVASAVSDGFLAHRMASVLVDAAIVLLLRGHDIETIDAALEWYGFAIGPFKLADAIGLDMLLSLQRPHVSVPGAQVRTVLERIVEAGRTGRRTGAGFYRYASNKPGPVFDQSLKSLYADMVPGKGKLTRADMVRRVLAALANQGAFLVQSGITRRPSDLDVLMIQVFGFPRRRGGPMMAADLTGVLRVKRDLDLFMPEAPELWTPAPLWTELLNGNRTLGSMND
ncbi:MAG: 3-hydroxyacyl-CoA dehydrogenase NAD-binding domain-containing protein [Pseudomonadota bacterium]